MPLFCGSWNRIWKMWNCPGEGWMGLWPSLLFMPYLSASFPSLLALTVCLLLISWMQRPCKQFVCLLNCIQILREWLKSRGLARKFVFKIFFCLYSWPHVYHLDINARAFGRSKRPCIVVRREWPTGTPFFPWLPVFWLSIHWLCLLIG